MQNLKLVKARDKYSYDKYEYVTGTEGPVIEFEVSYYVGGQSMFSETSRPRGLYVELQPVTYELWKGSDGKQHTSRVHTIGRSDGPRSGRVLLQEIPRFNAKKLAEAAAHFDRFAKVIADMWVADLPRAVELLREQVEAFQKKVEPKAA